MQAVLNILDKVAETTKDIPPVDNKASRFGNPAFRAFYDKIAEVRPAYTVLCSAAYQTHISSQLSPELHRSIPGLPEAAIPEVRVYLEEALGNRTRIDYGSGMELNFLCWMCVPPSSVWATVR